MTAANQRKRARELTAEARELFARADALTRDPGTWGDGIKLRHAAGQKLTIAEFYRAGLMVAS